MAAIYDLSVNVQANDIDEFGHVNNVVYVSWMQNIARAHVEALGLGLKQYLEMNHAMVAIEHQIQYRKAALINDQIILRSWLDGLDSLYSTRQYVFYRPSDQSILCVAKTKWACVELSTGRPKRMSPTFLAAYQVLPEALNPLDFTQDYSAQSV